MESENLFHKARSTIYQLKETGFENIEIFDLQGRKIRYLPNTTSIELYYLCNILKPDQTTR